MSPALWATKPLVAQLGDKIPGVITWLLEKKVPGIDFVVADGYLKNNEIAWAKGPDGEFRFPGKFAKACDWNARMFDLHPFAVGGIAGANFSMLTGAVCEEWRRILTEVATNGVNGNTVQTRLLFGNKDIVVDVRSPHLRRMSELSNVTLVELEGLGHESLSEDTTPIAENLKKFLKASYS